MPKTVHLQMDLVESAQAQKEVTINEALVRIDVLLNNGVVDKDLATPPASPAEGTLYIVGSGASGAWGGQEGKLAYFEQVWHFITPYEGATFWVNDENRLYSFNGAGWVQSASGGGGGASSLQDLTDISFSALAAGHVLVYDAVNGVWKNGTLGASHTHSLSQITDAGALAARNTVNNADWSGTPLTVANGGTGVQTFAANALVKGNGTGALAASSVTVSANNEISGYGYAVSVQTGASYTLTAADAGVVLELSHSANFTLTLPNSLPKGFTVTVVQKGAGQVVFSPASGAVLHNRYGFTRTSGQYAVCTLYVSSNSGANAAYILAGDGA